MRGLTGVCLAVLLTAGAVTATVLGGAREGTDTIGHRAAPQVVRSADLYFALNDMDAQAANLLLFGADPDFAAARGQALDTYERSRARADSDLQRVAEAVVGDPAGQRAVQTVIGELGRYEGRVARAQLLEEQAKAPAGKPSAEALAATGKRRTCCGSACCRRWTRSPRPTRPRWSGSTARSGAISARGGGGSWPPACWRSRRWGSCSGCWRCVSGGW
nr:hypothetical protein KPHV_06580 [Kitasatospora purpeofusca]